MNAELRKARLDIVDKVQAQLNQEIEDWKRCMSPREHDFDIRVMKDGETLKTTFWTGSAVEYFVDKEADEIWLYNDKEPYTKLYPTTKESE